MRQSVKFEQSSPKTNITIPLSTTLEQRLQEVAQLSQKSAQDLIIEAVENHLKKFTIQQNCYDLAQELGVIGVAEDLSPDLSTNPQHFQGFGQ